jgi:glutathione S-transferase
MAGASNPISGFELRPSFGLRVSAFGFLPAFPLVTVNRLGLKWPRGETLSLNMIELIQFPWSPFCIIQQRILEFSGARFKITNIPPNDRSRVWKLTRQRYYGVPIIRQGKAVIFEVSEDSQVIAKYLDTKLELGLFPWDLEGVQSLVWRYIENEVEVVGFKLNDIYWRENVPAAQQLGFLRHKERKFGRGCIDQWRAQQKDLLAQLTQRLVPFEEMLMYKPFLLDDRPRFVDFDLYGILGNFLYSGHYRLPAAHTRLRKWHEAMNRVKLQEVMEEDDVPF